MNILITGTSTGFGKMMTKSLAPKHNVIATMRDTEGKNEASAKELASLENVEVMELDVTKQETIDAAISKALEKYKKIDVLVNNAGVISMGPLESYSPEQVQKLFDINVYGVLRVNNAVLPSMRKEGSGLIINISSGLGFFPMPFAGPYCASKATLESLVRGSYYELLPHGIENILIEPGAYPTEIMEKGGVPGDREEAVAAYQKQFEEFQTNMGKMFETMKEKKVDPQVIADKTVELIEMPSGQRPIRSFVDIIAGQELTDEIVKTLGDIEAKWLKSYGMGG